MGFSIFSRLCNHLHNLTLEYFHPSEKKCSKHHLVPFSNRFPFPPPSAPGNPSSTLSLWILAFFQIILNNNFEG